MIIFMSRYARNPKRPHRLVVEMSGEDYRILCEQWNVGTGSLRLGLILGEKDVYLTKPRGNEGFLVSKAGRAQARWRVEFRSDTYRAISKMPTFGTSECKGLLEVKNGQTFLCVELPQNPRAARPYRSRKTTKAAAAPAATVLAPDSLLPAKLFVGDQEFDLQLTVVEMLDFVSRHRAA